MHNHVSLLASNRHTGTTNLTALVSRIKLIQTCHSVLIFTKNCPWYWEHQKPPEYQGVGNRSSQRRSKDCLRNHQITTVTSHLSGTRSSFHYQQGTACDKELQSSTSREQSMRSSTSTTHSLLLGDANLHRVHRSDLANNCSIKNIHGAVGTGTSGT